jgi:hypothetical protein
MTAKMMTTTKQLSMTVRVAASMVPAASCGRATTDNMTAFSPTDTMPLTGRAKALMALQSLISLGVLVVVLVRVVNILPG